MKDLTAKQKKVLDVIRQGAQNGLPPTVREICRATGIRSTSSVHAYLKILEENGYISRQSGLTRAIQMPGEAVSRIPLLGVVTAGIPILAVENIEEYIPYSGNLPPNELFALRVIGDSMINAGILDGDVVVVHQDAAVRNGDIVVGMIDEQATVKRFFKERGAVRLQPENDAYQPIVSADAVVLGKVVCLIRYL